jgi:hypothetical protein
LEPPSHSHSLLSPFRSIGVSKPSTPSINLTVPTQANISHPRTARGTPYVTSPHNPRTSPHLTSPHLPHIADRRPRASFSKTESVTRSPRAPEPQSPRAPETPSPPSCAGVPSATGLSWTEDLEPEQFRLCGRKQVSVGAGVGVGVGVGLGVQVVQVWVRVPVCVSVCVPVCGA